jgi:hypothetical protein
MKPSRETVDRLQSVWRTRGEELLQMESGLDVSYNIGSSHLGEEGEIFFLDIPSLGLIEPIYVISAGCRITGISRPLEAQYRICRSQKSDLYR